MRGIRGCSVIRLHEFPLASVVIFACLASGILILPAAGDSPSAAPAVQARSGRLAAGAADAGLSRAAGSDLSRGARLFVRDCAHCHGATGDGDSPVRNTLHPQPLDLTEFEVTDSFVLQVLHDGVAGSDMPAWHVSPETDLRAEAAYTARLARPDTLAEQDQYAPPGALAEAGKRVFQVHCARCHGATGNGDGPDARKHWPRPPSFAGMRPSFQAAWQVIENGVAGTAMPSWPLLTPQEIQAVTYYLRSFYNNRAASRSSEAITGVVP